MAWSCNAYYDYLFDRTPHFDEDVLRDWYPTDDAWIGQVATGAWDSFTGTQHSYDRIHVAAPDMSGAWSVFYTQDGTCVNNACAPSEVVVGWGSTRKTYDRYRKSYTTHPLCFDQINTRAKAKEQMAQILRGLKDITKMIQADYLRTAAVMFSDTLHIAGSNMTEFALSAGAFSGNMLTLNLGSTANLPSSELTIQYLSRFYEPLQFNGYFKGKYVPNGLFKLITDPVTSQQLTQMNPALVSGFKFDNFQKGGELFKYGMSQGIGNFGIAWDGFPARFYHTNNGILRRVWPYENAAATIGQKPVVSTQYIKAPYQISYIWHPQAMRRFVPNMTPVNPEMPFLTRDLAGKWNFMGGNRDRTLIVTDPTTGTQCSIDNKRGNQGLFFADFENAVKFEYPEWTRCILHQRDPGCVNDLPSCSTPPAYTIQTWGDPNGVCPTVS